LARALYADSDIYLLDDIFAAVDHKVGSLLFERVIHGPFLQNKAVVMTMHQVRYTQFADIILVLSQDGRMVARGTLQDIVEEFEAAKIAADDNDAILAMEEVALFSQSLHVHVVEEETRTENHSDETKNVSDNVPDEENNQLILPPSPSHSIDDEEHDNSTAEQNTSSLTIITPPPPQLFDTSTDNLSNTIVSPNPIVVVKEEHFSNSSSSTSSTETDNIVKKETNVEGNLSWGMILHYLNGAGNNLYIAFVALLLVSATVVFLLSSVALTAWAGSSPQSASAISSPSAKLYALLVFISFLLSMARAVLFFIAATRASEVAQDLALQSVLTAHLGWFNANPSGRIMNRFSKDVGVLDDTLPLIAFDFAATLFLCAGIVILVCSITPWVILPVLPLAYLSLKLRARFMPASRAVKRLEGSTRSPILAIVTETLAGLPVIRALRMQKQFITASDANLTAYFSFICSGRWLGLRLDAGCFVLLIATLIAALYARTFLSPALIGLSLSSVLQGMLLLFNFFDTIHF
jgi:ATP-binding cassette, subfamily C (CFTR/MRP), member 4